MPDAADCEIRRQASQTCPDTPRKDDLQLSIGDRLDRMGEEDAEEEPPSPHGRGGVSGAGRSQSNIGDWGG